MTILFAGGGTGGHIYPGVAIAKAVQKISPETKIIFVGTRSGLESKLVPKENFPIEYLPVGKLNQVSMIEKVKTIAKLPLAIFKSFYLIVKYRPEVVCGVGGYASGPIVLVASWLYRKTVVWEPNAQPGLTNCLLSRWVDLIIVVFNEAKALVKSRKVLQMPMPIRQELEIKKFHVPQTARFCVFVFGGSQGARAINKVVSEAILIAGEKFKTVEFIHQTGAADFVAVQQRYQEAAAQGKLSCKVTCIEYINDMIEKYAWADLVVCRAGTGTISEIAAQGKAGLFIPLPTAADDHQRKNAEALVAKGAALCVLQKDFTPNTFIQMILDLKANPEKLVEIGKQAETFHQPGGANAIARILLRQTEFL